MTKQTTIIEAKTVGFGKAKSEVNKLSNSLGGFAKKAGAAAAAYFGAQGLIQGSRRAIEAFGQQELAERKLEQALGRTSTELLRQAAALENLTTTGDEAIIAQQAFLASLEFSEKQIANIIPVALDLAAATGISLESAVRNTAKTFSGLTGELGELVPQLRELDREALMAGEAVNVMAALFKGQAQAETKTLTGSLQQMGNAIGTAAEALGEVFAPAVVYFAGIIKESANAVSGWLRDVGLIGSTAIQMVEFVDKATRSQQDFKESIATANLEELVAIMDTYGHSLEDVEQLQKDVSSGQTDLDQQEFSLFLSPDVIKNTSDLTLEQINLIIARLKELQAISDAPIIYKPEQIKQANILYNEFVTKNIEDETERQIALLDLEQEKLEESLKAHEDYEKAKADVQATFDQKRDKIRKEQIKKEHQQFVAQEMAVVDGIQVGIGALNSFGRAFKVGAQEQKSLTIAQAFADTFAGANKAFAQTGIMGFLQGTAIIAKGLANVRQIENAYKFEAGGLVGGNRHAQGGTIIEAEQGEFVMNRNAVQDIGVDILEEINSGNVGSGMVINISGNVMTDEFVSESLAPKIAEAVRAGTDFGI